jgi:hypothetical protein
MKEHPYCIHHHKILDKFKPYCPNCIYLQSLTEQEISLLNRQCSDLYIPKEPIILSECLLESKQNTTPQAIR